MVRARASIVALITRYSVGERQTFTRKPRHPWQQRTDKSTGRRKKTYDELKAAKIARDKHKREYNALITEAQERIWESAHMIKASFPGKRVEDIYNEISSRPSMRTQERKANCWNAFVRKKTKEINAGASPLIFSLRDKN